MEKGEIKQLVTDEVDKSVAQHFGVMKEWMADQFALSTERDLMTREIMERRFTEVDNELINIKERLTTLENKQVTESDPEPSWRRS